MTVSTETITGTVSMDATLFRPLPTHNAGGYERLYVVSSGTTVALAPPGIVTASAGTATSTEEGPTHVIMELQMPNRPVSGNDNIIEAYLTVTTATAGAPNSFNFGGVISAHVLKSSFVEGTQWSAVAGPPDRGAANEDGVTWNYVFLDEAAAVKIPWPELGGNYVGRDTNDKKDFGFGETGIVSMTAFTSEGGNSTRIDLTPYINTEGIKWGQKFRVLLKAAAAGTKFTAVTFYSKNSSLTPPTFSVEVEDKAPTQILDATPSPYPSDPRLAQINYTPSDDSDLTSFALYYKEGASGVTSADDGFPVKEGSSGSGGTTVTDVGVGRVIQRTVPPFGPLGVSLGTTVYAVINMLDKNGNSQKSNEFSWFQPRFGGQLAGMKGSTAYSAMKHFVRKKDGTVSESSFLNAIEDELILRVAANTRNDFGHIKVDWNDAATGRNESISSATARDGSAYYELRHRFHTHGSPQVRARVVSGAGFEQKYAPVADATAIIPVRPIPPTINTLHVSPNDVFTSIGTARLGIRDKNIIRASAEGGSPMSDVTASSFFWDSISGATGAWTAWSKSSTEATYHRTSWATSTASTRHVRCVIRDSLGRYGPQPDDVYSSSAGALPSEISYAARSSGTVVGAEFPIIGAGAIGRHWVGWVDEPTSDKIHLYYNPSATGGSPGAATWKYASTNGTWKALTVVDGTVSSGNAFGQRGWVTITRPSDWVKQSMWTGGPSRYWARAIVADETADTQGLWMAWGANTDVEVSGTPTLNLKRSDEDGGQLRDGYRVVRDALTRAVIRNVDTPTSDYGFTATGKLGAREIEIEGVADTTATSTTYPIDWRRIMDAYKNEKRIIIPLPRISGTDFDALVEMQRSPSIRSANDPNEIAWTIVGTVINNLDSDGDIIL